MEFTWGRPRKIFHFDKVQTDIEHNEEELWEKKWSIIETTVTDFLLNDHKPPSIILMMRALENLLNRQHFNRLHQNLIKTFYTIYKQIVARAGKEANSLAFILAYFALKKSQYKIIFDMLNNYLSRYYSDKSTIESKAYKILCLEIVNSSYSEKIGQELMEVIYEFRTTNDQSQLLELQHQLNIVRNIGMYDYYDGQFLEKSKYYFVKTAKKMVKNQEIFTTIDDAIKRQNALNKLLRPSQNTISYLQKQYIEEYYPFLIEYMDYLVQQNKIEKLKLLWQFTSRMGADQLQMLQHRLKDIVEDSNKYLKKGINISQILLFRDKIHHIIIFCFHNNKAILNIMHNTLESVLLQHQKYYSEALTHKILQDQQKDNEETVHQLFKLLPNKQKFIKEFQIGFFQWFIQARNIDNFIYEETVIQMMKKQCGNNLCKKIDRMLLDVWRQGKIIAYHNSKGTFHCRMLSQNDWPKFKYKNIQLPQAMTNIISEFEDEFNKFPQNSSKQLIWVNELGSIELLINGVPSIFSQTEAAMLFILDKSFRPMKAEQLSEVLQAQEDEICQNLSLLVAGGILQFNQMNQTYDINDNNQTSYIHKNKQKHSIEKTTVVEVKDNTIVIEAAVVRILKKKKTMPKTELSNEVMNLLAFSNPKVQEINSALQRLEKRQFIQIDKTKGILRYRQ